MGNKINLELTLQKIEKCSVELEALRFIHKASLFPMEAMEDDAGPDAVHTKIPPWNTHHLVTHGEEFCGRDRYLWLRKQVRIPALQPGMTPVCLFNFGKTGDGHNSGFESLLYVNGEFYQGVDSNHHEVLFQKMAGKEIELIFMLWTGLEGRQPPKIQEHRMRQAELCMLHHDTDELYYALLAIGGTLRLLSQDDPTFITLLEGAEQALYQLDRDEDRFYETVPAALGALRARLEAVTKDKAVTVSCVGHTHIDVAWLWRLKHTREKAMRSFSSVLRLMEEFPEYSFLQSQPQLYQYIKEDAPELYRQIQNRAAQGKWEPEGGMWLEADCNISSGEALVRQFLYGIRFFQREFGVRCRYLWLPDVFGYSWALPQIMKQCGIETFMTTKIGWNQYNTIPNDVFFWRGIDGSEVLTYFIKAPDRDDDLTTRASTYNGRITPSSVVGTWLRFQNKEITGEVLLAFGFGDGGGGPNRDMLRMRQVMDSLPGLPQVRPTTAGAFFERLHKAVKEKRQAVSTWDGELYLEYHRGTYTSQAANKYWNRRIENELSEAECLSVLACKEMSYPKQKLDEAWEILLRNQFHDIIPGSSIHEVYQDSAAEYRQAAKLLEEIRATALGHLVKPENNTYTIFSPSPFTRREVISLNSDQCGSFYIGNQPKKAFRQKDSYQMEIELEPMAFTNLRFVPGEETSTEQYFSLNDDEITTPFYIIRLNEDGSLAGLYDREHQRQVLGGPGNLLEVYEDRPLDYENWDIDFFHTQKREPVLLEAAPEIVENGLRFVTRFRYRYRKSVFIQDMVLYAGNRRIDFVTSVDWQESRRLLKTAFYTAVRTTKANYDIQFGHTERPTHQNTSWDIARFEVVGHKWADLSDNSYGVSLLNNCKYGYSTKGSELRLTLLKSGKSPDPQADIGLHQFTYSLLPHSGTVTQGDTIPQAYAINLPPRVLPGSCLITAPAIQTGTDALMIDAFKQAEDGSGIVARLHECKGGSGRAKPQCSLPIVSVRECNLLEEPIGEPFTPESWEFSYGPFEIKSFRLEL